MLVMQTNVMVIGSILERSSLFQGLSPAQQELLRPVFDTCNHPSGKVIFEQGEPAQYLYLLVQGEVDVNFKPDDGPELTLSHLMPGDVVGWSAALGRSTYTASAVCITNSQFLRVCTHDLYNICANYPDTGRIIIDHLAAMVAKRINNTHAQVVAMLENSIYKPTGSKNDESYK